MTAPKLTTAAQSPFGGIESGFTLLEVMVAIAILGLGLTVILSSQVGLFSSAARVEHLTYATNLARCKMEEQNLELLKEGYSLLDEEDEGPCCEDDETPGFRCVWTVQRVELPEPLELGDQSDLDGGAGLDSVEGLGAIGALADLGKSDGQALGEKPDIGELAGAMTERGGMQGLVPMLMALVYPSLKPMLEASIRKVTVRVLWKEGLNERELAVTQYVTSPQQGGLDAMLAETTTEPGTAADATGGNVRNRNVTFERVDGP